MSAQPAALRNGGPILEVLRAIMPPEPTVFEAASGRGHHAMAYAGEFEGLAWYPSDANPDRVADMDRRFAEGALPAIRPPRRVDVRDAGWEAAVLADIGAVDMVFNVNMIHIAPWDACLGLMAGAGRLLHDGGFLFLYGPFNVDGEYTSEGNAAFDRELRAQDPEWGIRELEAVRYAGWTAGLKFERRVDMPANNMSLIFRRDGGTD